MAMVYGHAERSPETDALARVQHEVAAVMLNPRSWYGLAIKELTDAGHTLSQAEDLIAGAVTHVVNGEAYARDYLLD
jgi:hypothetical protein